MQARSIVATAAVLLLAAGASRAAPISVGFDPSTSSVLPGQVFDVLVVADIPDPVVGFGLDLSFDPGLLSLTGLTIGPTFNQVPSPDGDDFAGLAFPAAVSGPGTVLADLQFTALGSLGTTQIKLGFTPGDLTEGFALETGEFAELVALAATVNVVPEPATLGLIALGAGLSGLGRRRR